MTGIYNYKYRRKVVLYNYGDDIIDSFVRIILPQNLLINKINNNLTDLAFFDEYYNEVPRILFKIDQNTILVLVKTTIYSGSYKFLNMCYGSEIIKNNDWYSGYFDTPENTYNIYGNIDINNRTLQSFGYNSFKSKNKFSIFQGLNLLAVWEPINISSDYYIRIGITYNEMQDSPDVRYFGCGYNRSGTNFNLVNYIDTSTASVPYTIYNNTNVLFCNISINNNLIRIRSSILDRLDSIVNIMNTSFINYPSINMYTLLQPIIHLLNIRCYGFFIWNESIDSNISYKILDEEKLYFNIAHNIRLYSDYSINDIPIEFEINANDLLSNTTDHTILMNSPRTLIVMNNIYDEIDLSFSYNNDKEFISNSNTQLKIFIDKNNYNYNRDVFNNIIYEGIYKWRLNTNNMYNCLFVIFDNTNENMIIRNITTDLNIHQTDFTIFNGINSILIYSNDNNSKIYVNGTIIGEFNVKPDNIINGINKILYILGFNKIFNNNDEIQNFIENYNKIIYIQRR